MNVHAAELQSKTLATAHRTRTEWTLSEITDLMELKETGFSMVDIAAYLNRTYYAVTSMLHIVSTNSDDVVRSLSAMAAHRQSNQMQPACEACWLIHPGDC